MDNNTNSGGFASWFSPVSSLIGSVVGGITALLGKNAEVQKAQTELQTAQQAVLAEKEKTKQAGYAVDVEKLKLLEAREITAQTALTTAQNVAKNKANNGLLTIAAVLVFLFGIVFLFVKFVLPFLFPKPQPQNVVIQDQ